MSQTESNVSKTEKIARERKDFLCSLAATFDSPDGQRILAWLHFTAATRKPAFLPGDRDPYAAASRDGRKSLVWEIEANLEEARASVGASDPSHKPTTSGAPRARRKRA